MKVALLAPIASSAYCRQLLHSLVGEPGFCVCAVVIRSPFSLDRFRAEYRRDGTRLLRKIREKIILPREDEAGLAGQPSIQEMCSEHRIPCLVVPDHNHPRAVRLLRESLPDLILFTGGGLLRKALLEIPSIGVINCHSGILPAYRGMDVVEWALLEGLPNHVGLTLHLMDSGVDTGPILFQRHVPLQYQEKLVHLRKRMESLMPGVMLEAARGLRDGKLVPHLQKAAQGKQSFVMHPRLKARID